MKTAIGYLRVSTQEQGRSGSSLDAQRFDIEAFGSRERFKVKSWHQDVQTGAGKDPLLLRPGLALAQGGPRLTLPGHRFPARSALAQRAFHRRAHGTRRCLPGKTGRIRFRKSRVLAGARRGCLPTPTSLKIARKLRVATVY